MADGIKGKLEDAGHTVADAAKTAGSKIADGVGQATDWVKEKVGADTCGSSKSVADIQPHMDVVASCGTKVGTVDHLEGTSAIKLTRSGSSDGQHHFIPTSWVAHVDKHVHLSKNSMETTAGWKSDAAAFAG